MVAARAAQALRSAQGTGVLMTAGLIVGVTLLALAGVGAPLRPLFPLASLLLAGYFLLTDRREGLLELVLWLFLVTPGIRRIVDLSAGWDVVNVLMLAPYTAAMPCVIPALKGLTGRRFSYGFPFLLIIVCVVYAVVLAAVGGRVISGMFDGIRWVVPPCIGLMIALEPERREGYRDVFMRSLMLGTILLSAYGVYQYLFVPAWDAFWMRNVDMNSIGFPEPFQVRVFSTMNAPGSLAVVLMCALLTILPARGWLRWPALGLGGAALLLTLVRSAWLGAVMGFVYMLLAGRGMRVRGSILMAVLGLGLAVPILQQIPETAVLLNDRLTSLTELSGDASAADRSNGYAEFFNVRLAKDPFGIGLAVRGAIAANLDQGESTTMDGALIEVGTSMGVVAGSLYFAAVALVVLVSMRAGIGAMDGFTTGCAATLFAMTAMLTSGTTTIGEMGFFFWCAAGFCLAAAQPVHAAVRLVPGAAMAALDPRSTRPVG